MDPCILITQVISKGMAVFIMGTNHVISPFMLYVSSYKPNKGVGPFPFSPCFILNPCFIPVP